MFSRYSRSVAHYYLSANQVCLVFASEWRLKNSGYTLDTKERTIKAFLKSPIIFLGFPHFAEYSVSAIIFTQLVCKKSILTKMWIKLSFRSGNFILKCARNNVFVRLKTWELLVWNIETVRITRANCTNYVDEYVMYFWIIGNSKI